MSTRKLISFKLDRNNPFCVASPLRRKPTHITRNSSQFSQDSFINACESNNVRTPVDIQCHEWDYFSLASLLNRTSSSGQYLWWKRHQLQGNPSTMIFEPLVMLVAPSSPSYLALCMPHVACTIPVPKDANSLYAQPHWFLTTTPYSLKQDK